MQSELERLVKDLKKANWRFGNDVLIWSQCEGVRGMPTLIGHWMSGSVPLYGEHQVGADALGFDVPHTQSDLIR